MMHECPKCGFLQPKDRYCANCGIDIDNFKPAPKSLGKKFLDNTGLQIALVILLVVGAGIFLYVTQKDQIRKQLSNIAQTTQATPEPTMETADMDSQRQVEMADAAGGVAAQVSDEDETTPVNGTAVAPNGRAATAGGRRTISFAFAEVTKPLAQRISSEGQILSENSNTRIVLIRNADAAQKYGNSEEYGPLPGGETANLSTSSPVNFDFTNLSQQGGEDVGMNLSFTASQLTPTSVELTMHGLLMLKNAEGTSLNTSDIDGTFSFATTSSIVILGILPNSQIPDDDLMLFASTPLSILSSQPFVTSMTEFAIFITVK